jgi:hypothetical protein
MFSITYWWRVSKIISEGGRVMLIQGSAIFFMLWRIAGPSKPYSRIGQLEIGFSYQAF